MSLALEVVNKLVQQDRPSTGRIVVAQVLMYCSAKVQHLQESRKQRQGS